MWPRRNAKIDDIRRLMLAQLRVVSDAELRLALAEQIARATRMQSLWRLRSEVMAALVAVHGELLARQRMTDITFMFAGLLERDRRAEGAAPQSEPGWPASARATGTASSAQGLVNAGPQVRLDH